MIPAQIHWNGNHIIILLPGVSVYWGVTFEQEELFDAFWKHEYYVGKVGRVEANRRLRFLEDNIKNKIVKFEAAKRKPKKTLPKNFSYFRALLPFKLGVLKPRYRLIIEFLLLL